MTMSSDNLKATSTRRGSSRPRTGRLVAVAAAGSLLLGGLAPVVAASSAAADAPALGAVASTFQLAGEPAANNIKIDWSVVSGASSYQVLRSMSAESGYSAVATVPGTSFDDDGLDVGSTYHYEVRALGPAGKVLAASDETHAATYTPSGDFQTYDNTKQSSLRLKATLQADGTYYRFNYQSDSNGFTKLVQQTSTDGYSFSGDTTVFDRATLCASVTTVTPGECKLESMNIVKNPASGAFVLLAHFENAADYTLSEVAIAHATPGSSFQLDSVSQPLGHASHDLTFFADGDGTGYLISSANDNQDLNLYKLNADWTAVDALTSVLLAGQSREAPSLVHVGDYYYLFSSQTAGWYPSQGQYISATSLAGPWSEARDIGSTATFGAQSGGVVKIGDDYAMMANRWAANWKNPEPSNTSRMLPLSFNDGYATYDYYPTVKYDPAVGIVPVQTGAILSVGKPTRASAGSADAPGEDVTYSADKADNGTQDNADDYYKSETVPFSWEVDLQTADVISQIDLTTKMVKGSETYYDYTIEGSLDRKTYTTLVDEGDNTAVGFMSHAISSTAKYRYIRITVNKVVNVQNGNEADWARGINELTVYGTETDTPAPDTVETPTASVASGTYYAAQDVALADATDGATVYYTTDGSTPSAENGTKYTEPIHVDSSTTLKAIAVDDGSIDSEVLTRSYTIKDPGTAVSLAAPINLATYSGDKPALPAKVKVDTADGGTAEQAVAWDLSGYSFDNPYRSLTVYGTVGDSLTVSAQVEVVPPSIDYFIDSGTSGQTSPSFEGVKGLVGGTLLNQSSDQASTSGSWGYVTSSGFGGVQTSTTLNDKDSNGIYGINNSDQDLEYTLPDLPAGTYTVTAGFREWWTGPRFMSVLATPAGASSDTTLAANVTVGKGYPTSAMISSTFTQDTAGTATIKFRRVDGSEAPVVGWLAVAAGDVPVETTPVSVAAPTADIGAGIYKTTQKVTLSTTTGGAAIYYTTDGSDASRANGTKYTGPITVSASQTIKAVAISNGTASAQLEAAYDIEPDPGTYTSVPVGKTWYDTSGTPIQGHGGNILQHDGWYYWVGENKTSNSTTFAGISLYKSKDLKNWTYVKDILTSSSAPDLANANVERPKLLYNAKTDTFVLWGHWERASDYSASHLMVATSKTVDGDFTFLRDFRPGAGHVTTAYSDPTYTGDDDNWGYGSRDFTIYQDPATQDAYLVSTENDTDMRVYKLTDDYTDVDWKDSYPLFSGSRREAPALVKSGDYYFVFTSSQSGWYPNQAMYSYTKNIADPDGWSALQPVGNNTTFYSQPTNIIPLTGSSGQTTYVYMGDRWNPAELGASTYVWLPLDFSGTDGSDPSVAMTYQPSWSFDASTGAVTLPSDVLVSQGKPTEASDAASGHPASSANDGNLFNLNTSGDNTNFYQPSAVPASWTVDLGQQQDLSRIDLSFRSYNGSETYSGYTVDGSSDDQNWTRLESKLANKTVGFTSDTVSGHYRYVRVTLSKVVNDHNGSEADWAAGLVEVQVYATDAVPPTVEVSLPDAGSNGWYTAEPAAKVTATDDLSGVSSIQYRLGTSGDWTAYSGSVALTDADTVFQARATDKAGNVSAVVEKDVKIDTAKPTVSAFVDGERTLSITAHDGGSGVASVQYAAGQGPWTTYTDPVKLDASVTAVRYRATDVAGNLSAVGTLDLSDASAPMVKITLPKASETGWFRVAPKVTISASDSGSGVQSIEYRIGTTGAWTDYSTPVTLGDGSRTVYARATDNAGNVSSVVDQQLKVDTVQPAVRTSVSRSRRLTINARDSGSGVASIEYKIASGHWQGYHGPVVIPESSWQVQVRATDVAGNVRTLLAVAIAGGSLSQDRIAQGGHLRIVGGGFLGGEKVLIELHSMPRRLATVTADAAGSVEADVVIPANAPTGAHHVVLTGVRSSRTVALQLAVTTTQIGSAGSNATQHGTGLADTGADTLPYWWLLVALALIAVGGGLAVRRRNGES